jgi:hypothetical protein
VKPNEWESKRKIKCEMLLTNPTEGYCLPPSGNRPQPEMNTPMKTSQAEPQAIAAHTPGPWTSEANSFMICDADGFIAKVAGNNPNDAEVRANARLIAAAPELLAECEDVLDHLERMAGAATSPYVSGLRAVIAKAKGHA